MNVCVVDVYIYIYVVRCANSLENNNPFFRLRLGPFERLKPIRLDFGGSSAPDCETLTRR